MILVTSCANKPVAYSDILKKAKTELQVFPSDTHNLILTTGHIEIMNQSFNGYFAIKKICKQEYRINFSNEIGLTIFDFGLTPEEIRVYNVLKNLDKPALINKIGLFFKVFLFHPEEDAGSDVKLAFKPGGFEIKDKKKKEILCFNQDGVLEEKFRRSGLFGLKKVKVFYLDWNRGFPERILMKEGGVFRLGMELKIIKLR